MDRREQPVPPAEAPRYDLLEESVYDALALPERTANYLESISVFTLQDLLQCTRERLLAIPNFGELTLADVYRRLAAIGFHRRAPTPQEISNARARNSAKSRRVQRRRGRTG